MMLADILPPARWLMARACLSYLAALSKMWDGESGRGLATLNFTFTLEHGKPLKEARESFWRLELL